MYVLTAIKRIWYWWFVPWLKPNYKCGSRTCTLNIQVLHLRWTRSFISVMALYGTPQDRTLSLHIANSRKQKTGFLTGSYINPAYENSECSSMNCGKATQPSTFQEGYLPGSVSESPSFEHQYEDPSILVFCKSSLCLKSSTPKRNVNRLYESVGTRNTVEGLTSNGTKRSEASSGLWINRLISFLILMFSLTSLLLVVLILFGKLKPRNCCEKGEFEVQTLVSFSAALLLFPSM